MPANSVLARMAVVISGQTAEFNKAMAASSNTLKQFQSTVKTVGAAIGVSFGAVGVYRGLEYGIGVLSGFEKEMSAVRAITNATDSEFNELSRSALDLGRSTLYGAQSVASLQLAYSRLGFTTKEIIAASSATIDLATATGEDLAKSADIAGVTIRAFGLRASETRRVADILAVGFNKTALGLDNFGEAIKYVAPIAAANNVSLEETTALLGVLADAGIRGSMAGTSLRKIISELDKGSGSLSDKLKALAKSGFTSGEAMDEVGRTAYAALLTLVKYTDKTDELTTATRNANGEIAQMAAIMSENLSGDVTKLTNAFDGFLLSIGNTDIIRQVTRDLTGMLNFFSGNKVGKMADQLDILAHRIQSGGFKGGGLTGISNDTFIKSLKELRQEAGKPIDENSVVAQLSQRYKLNREQGEELLKIIKEINTALSFDEAVIAKFDKFTQGYKDITKAAEEFIALQRRNILESKVAEIQFGQRGDFGAMKAAQEVIANYERVIKVVKDYVKIKTEEATKPPVIPEAKEQLGLIQQLEKKIKDFGDAIKKSMDPNEIRSYTESIKLLNEEIDKLTGKKTVSDLPTQNVFNQDPFSGKGSPLDQKNLDEKFKKIKQNLGYFRDEVKATYADISGDTTKFITNFAEAFGEGLTNNFKNFGSGILLALADFMKNFGKQLIAIGVGALALKVAIKNPIVAIAAGIALVAAAGAVASHAQSNLSGAANGGSGAGSSAARYSDLAQQNNLKIEVVGKISGRDILLVGEKEAYAKSRGAG